MENKNQLIQHDNIKNSSTTKKNSCRKKLLFQDIIPKNTILTTVTGKEWLIGDKIGTGGFGYIYSAKENLDNLTNEYNYVIKIEPYTNGTLFVEMHFYYMLERTSNSDNFIKKKNIKTLGIPKFYGSGIFKDYRFIVIEKLGSDITQLITTCTEKDILQIGIHLLYTLEYIHERNYIHGDIKSTNILQKKVNNLENIIPYLIDYGIATRCATNDIPDKDQANNGTLLYISRDGHMGIMSKKNDLESLGYNLIDWLNYKLPWDIYYKKKDISKILEEKIYYMNNISKLITQTNMIKYMEYVNTIKINEFPNYDKLRKILDQ